MITLIETLNFRCLRNVHQRLDSFHVLVGPNASGKTTFLDTISFLSDLITKDLDHAVHARTANFQDLLWQRRGNEFELAVEANIPDARRSKLRVEDQRFDTIRYEIAVGLNSESNELEIRQDNLFLKIGVASANDKTNDSMPNRAPNSILTSNFGRFDSDHLPVAIKNSVGVTWRNDGHTQSMFDTIMPEVSILDENTQSMFPFTSGPRRSILSSIPFDEQLFPVASWFQNLLVNGVKSIVLNSMILRRASPPGQGHTFKPDGSNLPWVIDKFKKTSPVEFDNWLSHLRTALSDIKDIRTVQRDDDKHMYLVVCYDSGVEVPSWMVSDGTLLLFALTIPAYLSNFHGVYLIEEPENGIHPRAVETMLQSLSSVYDAQILLATHSVVVLGIVDAAQVLCFGKSPDGATTIVSGDRHPALTHWRGETNLGTLFGAGVLG